MSDTPEEQNQTQNSESQNNSNLSTWLFYLAAALTIGLIFYSFYKNKNMRNSDLESAVPPDIRLDTKPIISEKNAAGQIALISILGPIGGPQLGMTAVTIAKLRSVAKDPNVKAILLSISSPGGGTNESNIIWNEVLKVKASSKPVVAFFNGLAASGAYYISAPADKIIATPETLTGSIGVIGIFPNYSVLMKKVGVEMIVIKSGPQKDMLSPFRSMSGEEKRILQNLINESYEDFVNIVSDGRKMDKEKVRKLADGRIYSAKQALQNGLIDEIGYFEDAVRIAKKLANVEKVEVVEIQTYSGFGPLLQKFKNKTGNGFLLPAGIYYLNLALYLKFEPQ